MGTHYKRLDEALLMCTHNMFYGEMEKIIPEFLPNTSPSQFLRHSFSLTRAFAVCWYILQYAVFSSYHTPNFFQYYQLIVNENEISNSDYFTAAFCMF